MACAWVARSVGLLAQQGRQLLGTIVVEDVALPVGEGRRMGRRDAGDLEDRVAFAGGRRLRRIALLGLECLGEQRRAVGQSGNGALRGDRRRGDQLQMVCGRGLLAGRS